ncbi:MtrAB system histidine kinase MtrB [Mangrovihabitans endophyticus]|uniref:Sensor histidine kinase MtrB n=1 Tax=Mangrovihabitans endophyticus TaxID=1751298 RepID=A0A8J3FMU3_9ACTN|nr:MtrAB system histidine kinase MtrB [Mangrovihabitans endophyticus]GGK86111.1 two-component sensor histidine kinase [Mangrovihabitans endophyticus]
MPVRRTLRVVRRHWRVLARRTSRAVAPARREWRRSLQLRVVALTLVASSLLVGAFGWFVAAQSANILLNRAQDEVYAQLRGKVDYAYSQLGIFPSPYDTKLPGTLSTTLNYLADGEPAENGGAIVSMRAERWPTLEPVTSTGTDISALITPDMVHAVATEGRVARQIRTATVGGLTAKYLVYGSPVATKFGHVELYYMVPLTTEDRAANQIRTMVLVTGLALVILLGVVAGLVTRLVVTPVRVAARTAQRLSAGLLDQRMKVDGEDDLALLASAFNQMASNLQRQIVRLEEMSRLQRRFTSDVSHELRTPLTTVRMAADLIFAERDEFEPAVARSAELLQAELDRFESLLTDLLEISRFDAGFAALDAEHTDLVPIVERVADRLAGLAERVGVRIELHLPDQPVIAEVDPRRVERVLRNLVGNAVEHGEHKPVEVTMASDGAAVAITVRDHGVGLKSGEELLVFNRFWRADPSRARQTGGTGLGLSISVEDARLHGGWLEAWGMPGEGAQFRLTLPVRAGDRLVAAPLPLVPRDRHAVVEPEPGDGPATLPAGSTAAALPPGAGDDPADAGPADAGRADAGPADAGPAEAGPAEAPAADGVMEVRR